MRSRASFVIALLLTILTRPAIAFGSHDVELFELEGNAVGGSAAGDDWASLFPVDRGHGDIARVLVNDAAGDTSYYTGGGSKDLNDVTEWAHTSGDVAPDKDELTHAFAVAYHAEESAGAARRGDLMLYFGADRYANNGDAQIGFWFFRAPVGLGSGGRFTGRHTVGDILVLSHFTQGGRVGTVNVYRWVGSGGSDGSLDLIISGQDCAGGLRNDLQCSKENETVVSSPWSYTPKSGPSGSFPVGSFYEGGLNATRLVGVDCFSSYMAETRSSQSVTAQLKDLALGDLDTCPPVAAPASNPAPATATSNRTTGNRVAANPAPAPAMPATGTPIDVPFTVMIGLSLIAAGFVFRRTEFPESGRTGRWS